MEIGQALLIFGGIPLGLAVVISLAVWVGSWSRPAADDTGAREDVVFLVSATGAPDPGRLAPDGAMQLSATAASAGGGARGRW